MFQVEVYCRNEDEVIATFQTPAKLDADSMRKGLYVSDPIRAPSLNTINDGEQIFCRRCHGLAYFRTATGTLTPAVPGALSVAV